MEQIGNIIDANFSTLEQRLNSLDLRIKALEDKPSNSSSSSSSSVSSTPTERVFDSEAFYNALVLPSGVERPKFLGYPDGKNLDEWRKKVGPRKATTKANGKVKSTKTNDIISGLDIDDLDILHDGVVLIDCIVRDGTKVSNKNVKIIHCEFLDKDAGNLLVSSDADGLIVLNSYWHESSADCFRNGKNEVYCNNFIERLGHGKDSHADAWQTYHADGRKIDNVKIIANIVQMPINIGLRANRAFLFSNDVTRWLVAYNYLNGGVYTVEKEPQDDIVYAYNTFGYDYQYGIRTGGPWTAQNWYGNKMIDGRLA